MKKKILHITEAFGGGVFTFLESLCNHLADEFDITIAYSARAETPEDVSSHFRSGIRLIPMKHGQRSIRPDKDLCYFREIKALVREIKPDIVHLHSSKAGFVGRFAANPLRTTVIYTPHGYAMLKSDESSERRAVYRFLERIAARRGKTLTIAVSKSEYEVSKAINLNAIYISNGIDLSKMPPPLPAEKTSTLLKVGTLGRISPQKNPKAFNEIAASLPDYSFIWIGDGELRGDLTAANIEITGWLDRQDGLQQLNSCDVFLLTSKWEGLPISLLEAMCLKKLCIVSNIPGNRSVIRDGRNGYLADTIDTYAFQIKRAAERSNDSAAVVLEAYEDILREFNTDVMCRKYAKVYRGDIHEFPNGTVD